MDSLAVLVRLARQTLNEQRQALHAIDQAIAATQDQLNALREAMERERRAACELADRDLRLATYQRRVRTRERSLQAEGRRLERERAAQAGRLAERHLELRRLEILAERRAERIHAARQRQEQHSIDELALARRHITGAST